MDYPGNACAKAMDEIVDDQCREVFDIRVSKQKLRRTFETGVEEISYAVLPLNNWRPVG